MTACLAVTKAEIQEALGQPVTGGSEEIEGLDSTCDYSGLYGQVSITVRHLSEKLNLPAEIEALIKAVPDATVRDATGIGTRAFFVDIGGAGTQLHVLRGDHEYLMISVLGFGEASRVSVAVERIARKALARF